jgi:hypothetical protein
MTESTTTDDVAGGLMVKATINLPGVKRGEIIEADPGSEYVQGCLGAGYLVPVGSGETSPGGQVDP